MRRLVTLYLLIFFQAQLLSAQQEWEKRTQEAFQQGKMQEARRQAEAVLDNPSSRAIAHDWLGRIDFQEKRFEAAVSHFQEASSEGRFANEMVRDWSSALTKLGLNREACELLEKILIQDPTSVDLRYRLGILYMSQGLPLKALPHLEEAYKGGLRHAGVVLQLAQARMMAGRDDQAVLLLESFYDSGSSPDILLQAGKLLFDHVLYLKAVVPLEKAWKMRPGSYEIGMYLALSYYIATQYADCSAVLSDIKSGITPTLEFLVLRGSVLARLDKWEEARQSLERALKLYPNQPGAYLNFGLYYLERGQKEKATAMIEKGAQFMLKGAKLLYSIRSMEKCEGLTPPQDIKTLDTARGEFYSQFGRALHDSEQNGSALAVYLLALENDNHNEHTYSEIGRLCWEFDSYQVAESYLKKGLELHPNSWELHFNLGLVYQSISQAEKAVQHYRKAIGLEEPRVPSIHWVQLGTAQLNNPKTGEPEAEQSFMKALEIDPNNAQAHYQLGKLYLTQKNFLKAEQYLEKSITLDPSLVRAYYQYGMACLRNGKTAKGKEMLEAFNRKRALKANVNVTGMQAEPMSERILQ